MARRVIVHNHFATADWNAYPSYTLRELEQTLAEGSADQATLAKIRAEVEARKNGTSVQKVTPVTPWGGGSKVMPRVGRM